MQEETVVQTIRVLHHRDRHRLTTIRVLHHRDRHRLPSLERPHFTDPTHLRPLLPHLKKEKEACLLRIAWQAQSTQQQRRPTPRRPARRGGCLRGPSSTCCCLLVQKLRYRNRCLLCLERTLIQNLSLTLFSLIIQPTHTLALSHTFSLQNCCICNLLNSRVNSVLNFAWYTSRVHPPQSQSLTMSRSQSSMRNSFTEEQ